jgi:ComF family protein
MRLPPFSALRSWAVFEGPVRAAVHQLKYRRNVALGDALARPMADFCRRLDWPVEIVVPVPLGKRRLQERGYNQVGLIAMPLAALNRWRYAPRALSRLRETKSQVGLSAVERRENVQGAFRADPRPVSGRTILLMDDVATTGATISACAEALLSAGAKAVFALTLARALPHHGLQYV